MSQTIPPVSQRPALGCLFEVVETLVLTVLIFLGIQTFVAQPYKVQQSSMENTLLPEQYVLVDKLTPRWAPYSRGDIVVFDPPGTWSPRRRRAVHQARSSASRTTRSSSRDGKVFVNDIELDEPYIYADVDGDARRPTDPTAGGATEWVVAEGQLLVMGDHRQNSADSRSFGPIEVWHVIGRAWLRYWPFDTFGVLPDARPPRARTSAPRQPQPDSSPP